MQVPLAWQCHTQANRGAVAFGENMVKGQCGYVDEVAWFGRYWFVSSLDNPVDFSLQDDPPLVVVMAVIIVDLP